MSKKYIYRKTICRVVSMFLLMLNSSYVVVPDAEAMIDMRNEGKITLKLEELLDIETENPKINLVSKVLNLLPPSHFRTLYDVSVTEEGGSRGLANSKHVILNALDIENEKEFVAVFVHELGHVVDLGVFKGTSEENSGFFDMGSPIPIDDQSIEFYGIVWEGEDIKLPGVTRDDFVSGYASWNMFEDFAETYIFYILHEKHFQELLKKSERLAKKHQFIKDKVFGGRIYDFYAGDAYPEDIFDTTVLNFDLEKFLILAQEEKEKRYIASRARSKRKGRYKRRGKAPVYKIRVARTGGRGHGQS